jgi:hypothetical protein
MVNYLRYFFLQINVSLRGGTTKQSVSFYRIPFVKFIENAQSFQNNDYLGKGFGSNLADCFVVPPRNDTFS